MSEKLTHIEVGGEQLEAHDGEHLKKLEKKLEKEAHEAHEQDQVRKAETLETAREQIKDTAEDSSETLTELEQPTIQAQKPIIDREVSYKDTLQRLHSQEAPLERTFSKIIHSKPVNITSEALERSVGRASVIAGMFIITFMGTLVVYVLARQNGYATNVFDYVPVFMVAGGVIGLLFELIANLYKRAKLR